MAPYRCLDFNPGDQARINCSGSVWGGVWFTGNNGPDGWANSAPSTFPLPGAQGGRSFALIGRFTVGGASFSWQHIGSAAALTAPGWTQSQMTLRVNDNAPGNGSGSFNCTVERWRFV